jgi:hypothetical protein
MLWRSDLRMSSQARASASLPVRSKELMDGGNDMNQETPPMA